MNIVIIEDEQLTAKDLQSTLNELTYPIEIKAILKSVKEALVYFEKEKNIDLIFSDIQLGDGLSFEIFNSLAISIPVIFCTAYDEYALNAFKANGIDYILKPFNASIVEKAINKYRSLKGEIGKSNEFFKDMLTLFEQPQKGQGAVLVYQKDIILPIPVEHIAYFQIKDNQVYLSTFDKQIYHINKTLDELEQITGDTFFRVNRQFLLHRKSVKNASSYLARKTSVALTIPVDKIITVSKEKMPKFLSWLTAM